ncbi:uncharacterized protein [Montipora foliosa]|uniref:uncharacterized protein isoform X2 n=1 Tax=Montipora foliosa TaxID=591990 RepID=UPI0035F1395D
MACAFPESEGKYDAGRSDKVKVTILASEWGSSKGGLSTLNRNLAIQLAKFSGVEISFLVPQCSEKDKTEALSCDIHIIEARKLVAFEELELLSFPPGIFEEFLSVEQDAEERKHRSVLVFGRGDAEDFKLKGFDIAGKAVASLADTHLVFVGAPDGKHEEIAECFMECGLPANCLRVRGYEKSRESLKRLFCQVDLMLMPSRTDGFGLTGLEALSAGLPVLVSKNSGFGEALCKVPYGSFFVVNSDKPEVWAASIKNIIWEKDRHSRLVEAEKLRKSYQKKYCWTKQSDALLVKTISLVRAQLRIQIGVEAATEGSAQKGMGMDVQPPESQEVFQEVREPSTAKKQQVVVNTGLATESRGNGSIQSTQALLNRIAEKYLQDVSPSNPEEYNRFMIYLTEIRKALVVDVKSGSLIVTVEVGSEKILEELWEDYCKGHLNEVAQKFLVTEELLEEFGLMELKLTTLIAEEEYKACKRYFSVKEMTSSSPSAGTVAQVVEPEYRNWLALGHAWTELRHGLQSFIKRETETFYNNVTTSLAHAAPCTCSFVAKRRPKQYHDMVKCDWAKTLQAYHDKNKPNWKQSDSSKWLDPALGPWEIAKLYLPDKGRHDLTSAEDMDITTMLNFIIWCKHFSVPLHLVKGVRTIRNKWAHVSPLELSDADMQETFDAIENLLKDPNLAHEPDAQNALKEIVKLKRVSDLHSMEAKVLADFKAIIRKDKRAKVSADFKAIIPKDVQSINVKLANLAKESERNKELRTELKNEQEIIVKLEALGGMKPNPLMHAGYTLLILVLGHVFSNLAGNVKGVRKKNVVTWLMLLLFFHCFCLLDDSSLNGGCTAPRPEFTGRQWLYQQMESVLQSTDNRGVLITGTPGSGKSGFLRHLLCSKTSSPVVHGRILAHHFCMHLDKKTQDGVSFVRNLANMIAWKLGEYRQRILTDSFVRRVLYEECSQDPEWCFEHTIVRPLKDLKSNAPWYIVIDALDECFSDKADVVNILKCKARRLPKWLKLIVSSRNGSPILAGLEGLHRLELRSDNRENLLETEKVFIVFIFLFFIILIHLFLTNTVHNK